MNILFEKKADLATIVVSFIAGLFVYSVLSYLLVAQRISIPVAVAMSVLILGLTRYYSYDDNYYTRSKDSERSDTCGKNKSFGDQPKVKGSLLIILFVAIYAITIAICAFILKPELSIFVSWNDVGAANIIQLAAAIMLCFFFPGFAMVLIIAKKTMMSLLLKALLGYLFSMLITGLTAYIAAALFDIALSESKALLVIIYLVILVVFAICYHVNKINLKSTFQNSYRIFYRSVPLIKTKFWIVVKSRISELLIFGSLFMLLIIVTYFLFGAITIGDQWYHQGRALLFMSGTFREVALSGADGSYPPFQSALIAALTTLSGIPLVNAYASIAFLNITVVLAFYYFFSRWVAPNMKEAAMLACSLFTTSSGFGWTYLLALTVSTNRIISQNTVLEIFDRTRPLDVLLPTNFVIAAHPDLSTGLIYIALPAGFVLLGLLRLRFNSKFTSVAIVSAISILGILAHPEFYLFVIIACVLPLIFKMKERNFVYLGFIFAILTVYIVDLIFPGKYYTAIEIHGFPLLALNILFVAITWSLYLIRLKLPVLLVLNSKLDYLHEFRTKLVKQKVRLRFLTSVVIISIVAYAYTLSFIIWAQLSPDEIKIHTAGYSVPFYLYPMKLGLTGILGLAFVLSYLFKRYDRQLFVFGIIIIIAFVAGPFYDEHRFSKYIMAGMVGFASLLVYKILNFLKCHNKLILNRILVGIIIVSVTLSTLLFIGYNSLIVQTQDYTQTLGRRNFPSFSELRLFDFLRDKINVDEKKYNIATFPDEYDSREGVLITKLQAFSGLPNEKLYQSPLTLNASTLDAFYRLLNYSDNRFIIIPKSSIEKETAITAPTHFALDYFHRIYEDDSYIVLDVPELEPPTTDPAAEVALVFDDQNKVSSGTDTKILQYNNETFDLPEQIDNITIKGNNITESAILSAYKGNNGLWSKEIRLASKVNYIEIPFRILADSSDPAGLKWIEGDKIFHVLLSKTGLELSQKSRNEQDGTKILAQNLEIEKKKGIWYTLKIQRLEKSINVYVDDVLKISVPRALHTDVNGISKVGISYFNNTVEFGPLKIGTVSTSTQNLTSELAKYNDYYYPLSALALSRTSYDVFSDTDLSAFSKKITVLAFDPLKIEDTTFNSYIEYANAGGKLIVMNSDSNLKGRFSQLFSLHSYNNVTEPFATIMGHDADHAKLNVSGLVNRVEIRPAADENVLSSYVDHNNSKIAPFAVEKYFSNNGSIVLVNAEGYFNAISKTPRELFLSLSNIASLFGLHQAKDMTQVKVIKDHSTAIPIKRFIGNMEISGKVTLGSSSFLIDNETNTSDSFYTEHISISSKSNNLTRSFNNVQVRHLTLIGDYKIIINSTGVLTLPGMGSRHNYFNIQIPAGFNMSVALSPQRVSSAEIVVQNHSSIKVNDDTTIKFDNISESSSKTNHISVLLQSPQITIDGNSSFRTANFLGYSKPGVPLDITGRLKAKLNFVDQYIQPLRDGISTQYLTYLQSLTIDGDKQNKENFDLPADISPRAPIPLMKILSSSSNVILLISLAAVTLCGSWIVWAKIKRFKA